MVVGRAEGLIPVVCVRTTILELASCEGKQQMSYRVPRRVATPLRSFVDLWLGANGLALVLVFLVAWAAGGQKEDAPGSSQDQMFRMPVYGRGTPPPPRTRDEVLRYLSGAVKVRDASPFHVTLVAGRKDHGPGEHDYPNWQRVWARLLARGQGVEVRTSWEWPSDSDYAWSDVVVFYKALNYSAAEGKRMRAYLERGGGLVFLHWAVHGGSDPRGLADLIGMSGSLPGLRYRHGPVTLHFTPETHPITRNFSELHLVDETYWNLNRSMTRIRVLATSTEQGRERPQLWVVERERGRVFVCILGHYAWTFDDPLFRLLLLRGIAWAGGQPVDRLNDLIWPGARVTD